jgi:hypothetical protein
MTAPRAGGSATPSSSPAPGCLATAESSHLSACHLARQVPTSADFIRRISLTSPDAEDRVLFRPHMGTNNTR